MKIYRLVGPNVVLLNLENICAVFQEESWVLPGRFIPELENNPLLVSRDIHLISEDSIVDKKDFFSRYGLGASENRNWLYQQALKIRLAEEGSEDIFIIDGDSFLREETFRRAYGGRKLLTTLENIEKYESATKHLVGEPARGVSYIANGQFVYFGTGSRVAKRDVLARYFSNFDHSRNDFSEYQIFGTLQRSTHELYPLRIFRRADLLAYLGMPQRIVMKLVFLRGYDMACFEFHHRRSTLKAIFALAYLVIGKTW